jgi:hypothetical protein
LQGRPADVLTVSLALDLFCDSRARPLDLALLIDASPGIGRESHEALIAVLLRAIDAVDLARGGGVRVAVLPYDDRGVLESGAQLLAGRDAILAAIRRVQKSERPCITVPSNCAAAAALRRAGEIFDSAGSPQGGRAVLLASAGIGLRAGSPEFDPTVPCNELRQAAGSFKSRADRPLLATACASEAVGDCGSRCLFGVANEPRYTMHSRTPEWTQLGIQLPYLIEGSHDFHPVDEIRILDRLPAALAYVGGGSPASVEEGQLSWIGYPITSTWSISVSYRLQVQECSPLPIPSSEDASWILSLIKPRWGGGIQSGAIAIDEISLPCLPLTPATPTPASSTPTPTGSTPTPTSATPGTSTPGATGSATASPSPTTPGTPTGGTDPPRVAIHLPILLGRSCATEVDSRAVDWILAMDVSGSMSAQDGPEPAFAGASRWAMARWLGLAALGTMQPGVDRVAILQYGVAGDIALSPGGLLDCCQTATSVLVSDDGYVRRQNGRPWDALSLAGQVLASAPPYPEPRRQRVLFFTDQRESDLGEFDRARILDETAAARRAGIEILVVGLGRDMDSRWLARWSGAWSRLLDGRRASPPLDLFMAGWLACLP